MAVTTHGSKFSWVLHPEAVKGYLECRKLLVERETQLAYMRCNLDGKLISVTEEIGTYKIKNPSIAVIETELETVRAEIAEIDRLIGGGKGKS